MANDAVSLPPPAPRASQHHEANQSMYHNRYNGRNWHTEEASITRRHPRLAPPTRPPSRHNSRAPHSRPCSCAHTTHALAQHSDEASAPTPPHSQKKKTYPCSTEHPLSNPQPPSATAQSHSPSHSTRWLTQPPAPPPLWRQHHASVASASHTRRRAALRVPPTRVPLTSQHRRR